MDFKIQYKPGLVLNTKYDNFFSNTIAMSMGCYYTHTCWIREVTEDKVRIQEALGTKTKKVTSTWYSKSQLDELFKKNKLDVLDFGIEDDINFKLYCAEMEGMPYDYFAITELIISRITTLFGASADKFLHQRIFTKISKLMDARLTTEKSVDCSELLARGISRLKLIPVLKILDKDKYELVTPQDLSILHSKLKFKER